MKQETEITAEVDYMAGKFPITYRIYIDDELMSERTCSWDNNGFSLTENMWVKLDHGNHVIRLEKTSGDGDVFFRQVLVDGKKIDPTAPMFKV